MEYENDCDSLRDDGLILVKLDDLSFLSTALKCHGICLFIKHVIIRIY